MLANLCENVAGARAFRRASRLEEGKSWHAYAAEGGVAVRRAKIFGDKYHQRHI